jgi:hypothetical protein
MRTKQKLVSLAAISMGFIVPMVFMPSLVHSFYFPPAPEYQIETIIHEVEDLVTGGVLTKDQGTVLKTIVGEAQKIILDKNKTTKACNLLRNFIIQVQAYINTGVLAATKGQILIGSANEVIGQLR